MAVLNLGCSSDATTLSKTSEPLSFSLCYLHMLHRLPQIHQHHALNTDTCNMSGSTVPASERKWCRISWERDISRSLRVSHSAGFNDSRLPGQHVP